MVNVAELVLVPRVEVIEADALAATPVVVIENVALVEPDGTVTVDGTVAAALFDARFTTVPPAPAVVPSVTVPEDVVPPVTDVGLTAIVTVLAGFTVSDAEAEPPFAVAVMLPAEAVVVVFVVTVKFTVEALAGTVTVAGTVALLFAEVKVTVTPTEEGAAGVIVTVPTEEAGPTTDAGFRVKPVTTGAVTIRVAVLETPLRVAVIVGDSFTFGRKVVDVNVAVVAPAAMVTDAGGVVCELEAERLTTMPPVGAALLIVTVPVVLLPPRTVVGFNVKPVSTGALTAKVAVAVAEPVVAVIVSDLLADTATVVAVNVPVFCPAAIVIDAGTVAEASLDDSVTVIPPVGAMPVKVAVPVEETPPPTVAGLSATVVITGVLIVSVAVSGFPSLVAVIVAVALAVTAVVVTVKVAVVAPAKTVTDVGTVAAALLDDNVTTVPPVGAALFSVIVAVEETPPVTVLGLRTRLPTF